MKGETVKRTVFRPRSFHREIHCHIGAELATPAYIAEPFYVIGVLLEIFPVAVLEEERRRTFRLSYSVGRIEKRMRHEHVYALHVLNVRSYLHFFGRKRPAETAERLAETDFFIVNVRGGRAEPFCNLFRVSVYKVYSRSVKRAHRGEEIAFRLHERFDKIFSVQMPDVNKPVFMQKIGYYVEIPLFVKLRDGSVVIASRLNRNRAHVLPQTA